MKYRNRILFVLCGFLLTAANCYSQESTSKPEPNPASSPSASVQSGPGGALSNALAAACSQNQVEFIRFLTVRNQAKRAARIISAWVDPYLADPEVR